MNKDINSKALEVLNEMKRVAQDAGAMGCELNMAHYVSSGSEYSRSIRAAHDCDSVLCFAGWCATDQYFIDLVDVEARGNLTSLASCIHDDYSFFASGLHSDDLGCLFDACSGDRKVSARRLDLDLSLGHFNSTIESPTTFGNIIEVINALIARLKM